MRKKIFYVFAAVIMMVGTTGCSKDCDCDCCNQTGTASGSGTSQQQHQIVGCWKCTSSTYSVSGQTYSNTIKGWVAEFRDDGIAHVPGEASATTYTISGNTITLGTGTRINITELSSTTLKYNFTMTTSGTSYSYTCAFSRL